MTARTSARALAAFCLLATPAVMPAPAAATQIGLFIGTYRPIATDDEQVQGAGAAMAEHVGGELASVDEATKGGASFRVQITLADGSRYRGVATRQQDGSYVVHGQPTQIQGETDHGTNDGSDTSGDDDE